VRTGSRRAADWIRHARDGAALAQMDPTGLVNLHSNCEFRLPGGQWQEVEIGSGRIGLPASLPIRRTTMSAADDAGTVAYRRTDAGRVC
jgi:hypothetical protein